MMNQILPTFVSQCFCPFYFYSNNMSNGTLQLIFGFKSKLKRGLDILSITSNHLVKKTDHNLKDLYLLIYICASNF